jgi:hypothetical protein
MNYKKKKSFDLCFFIKNQTYNVVNNHFFIKSFTSSIYFLTSESNFNYSLNFITSSVYLKFKILKIIFFDHLFISLLF